jgi:hypothetical protein
MADCIHHLVVGGLCFAYEMAIIDDRLCDALWTATCDRNTASSIELEDPQPPHQRFATDIDRSSLCSFGNQLSLPGLALGYVTTTPRSDLLPAVVSRRSKATEHS